MHFFKLQHGFDIYENHVFISKMILTFVVRAALYKLCFFFFFFTAFSPGQQNREEISFNCLVFGSMVFFVFLNSFWWFFFFVVSWGFFRREIILKHGRKNASDLFFRFIFYFSNFWFYANVSGS